jgi:hypothetical protein
MLAPTVEQPSIARAADNLKAAKARSNDEMSWETPFPFRFGRNAFVLPELETINRAAYWDYQRQRVYVKSGHKPQRRPARKHGHTSIPTPNATIECPRPSSCPTCNSKLVYRHSKRSKTTVDLRFMRSE